MQVEHRRVVGLAIRCPFCKGTAEVNCDEGSPGYMVTTHTMPPCWVWLALDVTDYLAAVRATNPKGEPQPC